MTEYVAGWGLKIDCAREHLAQLEAEILGFFASGPFEVKSVTDQQARFVNYYLRVYRGKPIVPTLNRITDQVGAIVEQVIKAGLVAPPSRASRGVAD
jgi:hypothetical protein